MFDPSAEFINNLKFYGKLLKDRANDKEAPGQEFETINETQIKKKNELSEIIQK